MKRSEINTALKELEAMIQTTEHHYGKARRRQLKECVPLFRMWM